jgi:predicted nucleic acid-binding protein
MGLVLKPGDIIFLDTAPFVYFFEQHPAYFRPLELLFDNLYACGAQAITSIITYIELTTLPARQGKIQLVRKYRDYLFNSENINLFPLDTNIADHVVDLRAQFQFKTPDAIQLGTARACGADYILTNDKTWLRFEEIKIILVDELEPG